LDVGLGLAATLRHSFVQGLKLQKGTTT